jgi:hypothetical protein
MTAIITLNSKELLNQKVDIVQAWWHMVMTPPLERVRQEDCLMPTWAT